ncbi:LysM peptidoglycan-binding domain-containing protein [Bacillus shivajii]|uniref:GMC oxidoreductase n=1 Tax=Bacillus shivajii TaxID=1983719 RepID=UPI001CF98FCC|nr:GMC oxidoreductase [Bacillus shivajii]UCZ52108.1 LysM peptidoglycan-binding domain-containing protein [Bacillus shivajii]
MKIIIGKEGDTLKKIADRYKVNVKEILRVNKSISNKDINIGKKKVKVPSSPIKPSFIKRYSAKPQDKSSYRQYLPPPPEPPLKQWIPVTPLEEMTKVNYDVIIVGSGAGGGAVLWRLCEQWKKEGKRIAVLERGGLLLPTHAQNLPTFDHNRLARFVYTNSNPVDLLWPEFPGAAQFFALGGRTIQWGAVTPRFFPNVFQHWPITYEDLLPYYLIAEEVMNVNQGYPRGSNIQSTFLAQLRRGGYGDAMNMPMAVNLDTTKYGKVQSNVFFSSINFLALGLNIKPFDLAVNARVFEVLHEKDKAIGVKVISPEKKEYRIHGKTVVLSASTFENPRILMNSNIEGEAIGKYLTHHPFIVAEGKTNREKFEEVLGVASILVPESADRPFQLQIHGPDPFEYYWYHFKEQPLLHELWFGLQGFGVAEQRPENRVILDRENVDDFGIPKLRVYFSYTDRDRAIIDDMASRVEQVANILGLRLIVPPILKAPGVDIHETGTCRMGNDPEVSVTNQYGKVHGVNNLFVADNSVLPPSGAANPTLTTTALAIRTADYIAKRFKS